MKVKIIHGIKLGLLDANFFRTTQITPQEGETVSSLILTPVISNIYRVLRNLCMILMMLILLYIGIRIILSSSAKDQSKYKSWLNDWLIGFCLLFCMHFIMSFLNNMNSVVVQMLSNDEGDSYYFSLYELGDGAEGFKGGGTENSEWYDVITNLATMNSKKQNYVKDHIVIYNYFVILYTKM